MAFTQNPNQNALAKSSYFFLSSLIFLKHPLMQNMLFLQKKESVCITRTFLIVVEIKLTKALSCSMTVLKRQTDELVFS